MNQTKLATSTLAPLIGTWSLEADFPGVESAGPIGQATFAWALDGAWLEQRSVIAHPDAPDSFALIGPIDGGGLVQHYFDSRGVSREYAMTLVGDQWTLSRTASAPDFSQRFVGTIDTTGATITGAWEINHDGTWQHDFGLTYRRV